MSDPAPCAGAATDAMYPVATAARQRALDESQSIGRSRDVRSAALAEPMLPQREARAIEDRLLHGRRTRPQSWLGPRADVLNELVEAELARWDGREPQAVSGSDPAALDLLLFGAVMQS